MKRYGLLLSLTLLALPVAAQDWKVDYGRSQIGFTIKQMNVPVEGGFNRYTVKAMFDTGKPEQGTFEVELDIASINTGSEEGDDEAKRPAWFDTKRFPKARFVSMEQPGLLKRAWGWVTGLFVQPEPEPAPEPRRPRRRAPPAPAAPVELAPPAPPPEEPPPAPPAPEPGAPAAVNS